MSDEPTKPAPAVAFTFDSDAYTVDELEEIETLSGVTVSQAIRTGALPVRLIRAIAFVSAKRTGSTVTFAEMGGWSAPQLAEAVSNLLPPA